MKKFQIIIASILFSFSFAAAKLPGDSIYNIESQWKNQNGEATVLKNFQGELVLIGMLYTSCPHACPMILSKFAEIEKDLIKNKVKNYHIVLASFDPKTDTPENLKKFMKERKLNESKWTMLSGNSDADIRNLAVVLKISYKPMGEKDFSHSNVITLLDENGIPKASIDKLTASIKPITEKAVSLAK